MKRCKHNWQLQRFVGDPLLLSSWSCRIDERCASCQKERSRMPTTVEYNLEQQRLTCPCCGLRNDEHKEGIRPWPCVALLSQRIQDLTHRLTSIEDWRHR